MHSVVKARAAQDFLALVPQLVGHVPTNSLVLVGFRGNRTRAAIRFSLPAVHTDLVVKRVATTVVGTLCKLRSVDGVVPVIYTDQHAGESDSLPFAGLAARLVSRSRSAGFHVPDALCVANNGWGSYLDQDCPASGRPLALIQNSPIAEQIPVRARRELITPAEHARLPEADPAARTRVGIALRARGRRQHAGGLVTRLLITTEALLASEEETIPEEVVTELLYLISSVPGLQDGFMMQVGWGPAAMVQCIAELTGLNRADGRQSLTSLNALAGVGGRAPEQHRIKRATGALKKLTAVAPADYQTGLLCILAWLYWMQGLSSVAHLLVVRARDIEPTHPFAAVLEEMLNSGHLPEWAFSGPKPEPEFVPVPPV